MLRHSWEFVLGINWRVGKVWGFKILTENCYSFISFIFYCFFQRRVRHSGWIDRNQLNWEQNLRTFSRTINSFVKIYDTWYSSTLLQGRNVEIQERVIIIVIVSHHVLLSFNCIISLESMLHLLQHINLHNLIMLSDRIYIPIAIKPTHKMLNNHRLF